MSYYDSEIEPMQQCCEPKIQLYVAYMQMGNIKTADVWIDSGSDVNHYTVRKELLRELNLCNSSRGNNIKVISWSYCSRCTDKHNESITTRI